MTKQEQNAIEQAVGQVVRIGRLWAVYGLEVGRAALRTSSETLKATSDVLGTIAQRIEDEEATSAPSASETPPASADQAA